jgi:hypothetical protein
MCGRRSDGAHRTRNTLCAASGFLSVLFCRKQSIFQGTMDLVQQLCEASSNLVKVLPQEDRPARSFLTAAKLRPMVFAHCALAPHLDRLRYARL